MVMNLAGKVFFEFPVRNRSLTDLAAALDTNRAAIIERMESGPHNERNHGWATHIIGIEKWGQRRLTVALGEPFVEEEYDGYRPTSDTPWEALPQLFDETRDETVHLVQRLADADATTKVEHNSFGPLTMRGWTKYLDAHASMTAKLIR